MRAGILTAALLLAASNVCIAHAQVAAAPADRAPKTKAPSEMLLRADAVDYDTNRAITTARGHVEIDYEGRILTADRVVYDQNADKVTASGHVVLLDENGDVSFSNQAVLTDKLRNGVLQSFAGLIGKNGRLAGTDATRQGGVRTIAHNVAYTACVICNKPGQRTPIWEVKADRVVYDEPAHRLEYRNATLDAFGVPVLFTPFFSNSDPTVKRASGILVPEIGNSGVLGYYVRIPVYISLTDSQDFTIAPEFTTEAGYMLEGEYRQRWNNGGFWIQPTVTYDPNAGLLHDQGKLYSSIFGSGLLQLDNEWQTGFSVALTSNETYLELYKISQTQRLVNDLYVEGISGRSRFEITGYFFQGLLASDANNRFPVVLPLIEYSYVPESDLLGGQFRFDVNTAAISRQVGQTDQRLTSEAHWEYPVITANGQLITLAADVRGDVYHVNEPELSPQPSDHNVITRGLPYAAIDWRWPFVTNSESGKTSYIFEPIAQVIGAPYGGNPPGIPNEDSADFQFDETDIFSYDRVPGYDIVETGPRTNVGFRAQAIYPGGSVEWLVGEEFRLKADPIFASDSGITGTKSDIVSRLTVNFIPHFNVTERVDFDPDNGSLRRNEVYIDANWGRSSVELSYLKVPEEEVSLGLPTREEVNGQAMIEVAKYWLVYAAAQRNLETSTMIADELGFGYDDECLGVSLSYRRTYTTDRNVPPSTDLLVRFNLKTSQGPLDHSTLFPQYLYPHIPL